MRYPTLTKAHKSLMAKHLSREIFDKYKELKTANGFSFYQAIQSGLDNPDSGVGVYAGDKESYTLFRAMFTPIILEYHGINLDKPHQANLEIDDLDVKNVDPKGEYILSTRIRVGRNLKDFPLGPAISKEQRQEVERLVSSALICFENELKGTYYSLLGMSEEDKATLIQEHFLFKEGDRFLESAGLNRDWPSGRGIYHNSEKTFLVWINEEDQLRIISMQKGGDIKEVFSRLVKAIKELEKKVAFSFDEKLGYITSCPTNLGTAMRASVHIKLPKLAQNMSKFQAICDKYYLQIRGKDGEHSKSQDGIFDISNKRRLGVSEVECVLDMAKGVKALIEAEKAF